MYYVGKQNMPNSTQCYLTNVLPYSGYVYVRADLSYASRLLTLLPRHLDRQPPRLDRCAGVLILHRDQVSTHSP